MPVPRQIEELIMERRALFAIPAALVAGQALIAATDEGPAAASGHVSRKSLLKHTGAKATYKVPKSAGKQTKYVNSLTALLSLTSSQVQQVSAVLTNAATLRSSVKSGMKKTRKQLRDAVKNNDTNGIADAAAQLGELTGRHITQGALATATIFQVLTPAQQVKFAQMIG
jgi:Spy/CpxP family protein refolding chaperone